GTTSGDMPSPATLPGTGDSPAAPGDTTGDSAPMTSGATAFADPPDSGVRTGATSSPARAAATVCCSASGDTEDFCPATTLGDTPLPAGPAGGPAPTASPPSAPIGPCPPPPPPGPADSAVSADSARRSAVPPSTLVGFGESGPDSVRAVTTRAGG